MANTNVEPPSNDKKAEVSKKESSSDKKNKKDKKEEEELSEEDQNLKSQLELLVQRLQESNETLHAPALQQLKEFIRTSTSSMTAVPKPLKFLRPSYPGLRDLYSSYPDSSPNKRKFADILSVLAMTYSSEENPTHECLKYRLAAGYDDDDLKPSLWGHEYVRHLATEIGEEYVGRLERDTIDQESDQKQMEGGPKKTHLIDASIEEIMNFALTLIPFFLSHNAEVDAVDLLLELEAIKELPRFIDENTFDRVCRYMISCVPLLAPPDDIEFMKTAYDIYVHQNHLAQALALAIRLDDTELISSVFEKANDDISLKKQLAFILSRQQMGVASNFGIGEDDVLSNCYGNGQLHEYFEYLLTELNVKEAKIPEDIYKSHLESTPHGMPPAGSVDSAKQNLASTFVNAFVNAGSGHDKLLLENPTDTKWLFKTKDDGMLSTVASIGLLMLWDVDVGTGQLDKYSNYDDYNVKSGWLMGIGILSNKVQSETDVAQALIVDYLESRASTVTEKVSAIAALGIAYAGSYREDIMQQILPFVVESSTSMEISAVAALSLGLIYVGTCDGEIAEAIVTSMMEREEADLKDKWAKFMALGLALLFLGKQDASDAIVEALKSIPYPLARAAAVIVDICSYAGTGNVLKIQNLLHICNDHAEEGNEGEKEDIPQAFAVLGISLIAMGEDIGKEMAFRHFGHLMHYGDSIIRQTVPLALGLLSVSNPQNSVFDILSRYSHDNDIDVAINAIFAMGLVGAGTNNARLAQLLRSLATYYSRDANALFMVRIAQGLLHMGKGTMSIQPYHTDRQIYSRVGMAGLLTVLTALVEPRSFILDKAHWLLYYLVPSMHPRYLITVDEDLKTIPVSVRVGQAVDTVGQAGKPKTITGFQTHTTPVLLGYGDRAELATEAYKPLASVLEGVIILRKNDDIDEDK